MADNGKIYRDTRGRSVRYGNTTHTEYKRPVKKTKKKNTGSVFMSKLPALDFNFLTLVIVIVSFGIIMVFSSSAPKSLRTYGHSYKFVEKQLIFAVLGFIGMIVLSRIDYRKLKKYAGLAMIVCIGLLVLVIIPGVGVNHNGATRWLNVGMEIQPSEFMKPVMALFVAAKSQEKQYDLRTFKGTLLMFVWIGIVGILMFLEPHVSGAIVICGIAGVVMLCAGAKWKNLFACAAMSVPFGVLYVMTDSVRRGRILTALNPFADSQSGGYQVIQGLYAIASGGIFGRGLGQSIQKRTFLPEPYNDYIFAVICEELGLIGAILVIVLFAALIMKGISIALHAPDMFGTLAVVGIMAQITIQALINILVVTAIVPNTGMTLPFFSYGGSALMVLMLEMGIVLNVSRYKVRSRL